MMKGLVGHFAVGAVGVAVAVHHVVVVLVFFDKLHSALDAVELDVEMNRLQVADQPLLAHEGNGAHVAFVDIPAKVLLAQVALQNVAFFELFSAELASQVGRENFHALLSGISFNLSLHNLEILFFWRPLLVPITSPVPIFLLPWILSDTFYA